MITRFTAVGAVAAAPAAARLAPRRRRLGAGAAAGHDHHDDDGDRPRTSTTDDHDDDDDVHRTARRPRRRRPPRPRRPTTTAAATTTTTADHDDDHRRRTTTATDRPPRPRRRRRRRRPPRTGDHARRTTAPPPARRRRRPGAPPGHARRRDRTSSPIRSVAPPATPWAGRIDDAGRRRRGRTATRSITFPVAGPIRYGNDFGACRDGCRRQHKGNDLIGDRLQPLLAMHDGVVDRLLDHPTAGYGIVVRDDEGWEYHLYHVNNDTPGSDDGADDGHWRFAPGIGPGSPVHGRPGHRLDGRLGQLGGLGAPRPRRDPHARRPGDQPVLEPAPRAARRQLRPRRSSPTAAVAGAARDGSDPAHACRATGRRWRSRAGARARARRSSRMWIGPAGFTPIDAAALRVGDPRYDDDCAEPPPEMAPADPRRARPDPRHHPFVESGGDYTAQARGSTASGAYQFIDTSGAGTAATAGPATRRRPCRTPRPSSWCMRILARNGGDVVDDPRDVVHRPRPAWATSGTACRRVGQNTLTPRQYQAAVADGVRRHARRRRTSGSAGRAVDAVDTSGTCRTVVVDVGAADRSGAGAHADPGVRRRSPPTGPSSRPATRAIRNASPRPRRRPTRRSSSSARTEPAVDPVGGESALAAAAPTAQDAAMDRLAR